MLNSKKILVIYVLIFAVCNNPSYSQVLDPQQLSEQTRLMNEFVSLKFIRIDSLKKCLEDSPDTIRVNILNDLFSNTLALDNTSASRYLEQALLLAQRTNYAKGEGVTYVNKGKLMMEEKDLQLSEEYFRQGLSILKKHRLYLEYYNALRDFAYNLYLQHRYEEAKTANAEDYLYRLKTNDPRIAYNYRLLGIILDDQGYYEAAFQYFLADMQVSKRMKDIKGDRKSYIIFVNYYLGNLFEDAGDKKMAIAYYRESGRRALDNLMPDVYDEKMAAIHSLEGNYDSALYYYKLREFCLSLFIRDKRFFSIVADQLNVSSAEIFLKKKDYKQAIKLFRAALPYVGQFQFFRPEVFNGLANAYRLTGKLDLALHYATLLRTEAERCGSRALFRDAAELSWKTYDTANIKDSAYKYLKLYMQMRDTLAIDKQLRNIALLEMKERDNQQAAQIEILTKEKAIHQKQRQILVVILFSMVLAALFLLWNISLGRKHDAAQFEKRKLQLEMQALRAQMNPHFIFNTLNSINGYILKNERKEASQYLTKFSKLVRMILTNSQSQMISLVDELAALKLYIQLEQLRFDNHFSYSLEIAPDLDICSVKVPPLVIQPYVENAIWHGLMHKELSGHIDIELYSKENSLFCKISDDGIGRDKVRELKSECASTYKSVGMLITRERITKLSNMGVNEEPVQVTDLVGEDGDARGTSVIIKLPFRYDQDDLS